MSEVMNKFKIFFQNLLKPPASKAYLMTKINDSNPEVSKSCGFKSKKSQKTSTNKHNIPSSIVVLDENERQRLRYSLIQMNIRDNELLF